MVLVLSCDPFAALSPQKKPTPRSELKKVTFGLKNNQTAGENPHVAVVSLISHLLFEIGPQSPAVLGFLDGAVDSADPQVFLKNPQVWGGAAGPTLKCRHSGVWVSGSHTDG